jgi:hypothetical protein
MMMVSSFSFSVLLLLDVLVDVDKPSSFWGRPLDNSAASHRASNLPPDDAAAAAAAAADADMIDD